MKKLGSKEKVFQMSYHLLFIMSFGDQNQQTRGELFMLQNLVQKCLDKFEASIVYFEKNVTAVFI